jgi:GMP synthase-like glutamine amidotransferase
MSPLLVLDAYLDPRGGAHNYLPRLAGHEVEVARLAHGPCPTDARGYAGLFISGSGASVNGPLPWVAQAAALVRSAAAAKVPVLGICFGHQLIAHALFGPGAVRLAPFPELGFVEVERTAEHPLLAGYGRQFVTFQSHRDEVCERPGAIEVLARNAACAVQALAVRDLPFFGVQFHPEMARPEIEELVRERAPQQGGGEAEARALLNPSRDTRQQDAGALGDLLIRNFLELAAVPRRPAPVKR